MWLIEVTYEAATSSLFRTAVLNNDLKTSTLTMTTSGVDSGVAYLEVTGSSVPVVSITFTVKEDAAIGLHSNVVSLHVNDMVNSNTIKFPSYVTGQINDERGGVRNEGQVTIEAVAIAGIFAYAAKSELVNTAVLSGEVVSSALTTEAVFDQAGVSNTVVTGGSTCSLKSSSDEAAISVESNCTCVLNGEHASGSSRLPVVATYSSFTKTVYMVVWFPTSVWLNSSDTLLNRVGSDASCQRYQQSHLTPSLTSGPAPLKFRLK